MDHAKGRRNTGVLLTGTPLAEDGRESNPYTR